MQHKNQAWKTGPYVKCYFLAFKQHTVGMSDILNFFLLFLQKSHFFFLHILVAATFGNTVTAVGILCLPFHIHISRVLVMAVASGFTQWGVPAGNMTWSRPVEFWIVESDNLWWTWWSPELWAPSHCENYKSPTQKYYMFIIHFVLFHTSQKQQGLYLYSCKQSFHWSI